MERTPGDAWKTSLLQHSNDKGGHDGNVHTMVQGSAWGRGKIVVLDFDDAALLRQRSNRHVGLGRFGPVTWRSEMPDCSGRAQNNLERRGRSGRISA